MCVCLDLTEKTLAEQNLRLPVMASLVGGPDKVYLQTEVIQPKRGLRPMRLICTFCPFCGEKYPESEYRPTTN